MAETNLCQYWPRWFREILDYQALCQTEGGELRAMALAMDRVRQNMFVQTMDEGTAAQWESLLGIVPNLSADDLDFRRKRVLDRLSLRPPFTLTFLYGRLDSVFGPGGWKVELDYPNYTLYVEADISDQRYFQELAVTMGIIKPCHLVYVNRLRTAEALRLSERVERYRPQYNYILGGWELGKLPFVTELEKEAIKMPEQPSIQPELLNQTAGFVAGDVLAVRINGSLTITALSRATAGNVGSVSFRVLREQAEQVDQIELLDKDGAVLTACAVSVPVVDELIAFRHTFTVKEGT